MALSHLLAPLLLSLSLIIPVYGQTTTSLAPGTNGQLNACNAIVKFCPGGFPQSPDCIAKWCSAGPSGPCDPHCCSQPNRLACIQAIGSSVPSTLPSPFPSTLASAPADLTSAIPAGITTGPCRSLITMGASCAYKTTSFDRLAKTEQAKCLCYDNNGQYNPNPFDDGVSSCYVQATSAKAQGAEKISKGFGGFCSKYVGGGPAGLAAATTTSVSMTSSTASPVSGIPSPSSSQTSPISRPTSPSGALTNSNIAPSAPSPPTTSSSSTASAQTTNAAPRMRVSWIDPLAAILAILLL